jgi:hypothetical protein
VALEASFLIEVAAAEGLGSRRVVQPQRAGVEVKIETGDNPLVATTVCHSVHANRIRRSARR